LIQENDKARPVYNPNKEAGIQSLPHNSLKSYVTNPYSLTVSL